MHKLGNKFGWWARGSVLLLTAWAAPIWAQSIDIVGVKLGDTEEQTKKTLEQGEGKYELTMGTGVFAELSEQPFMLGMSGQGASYADSVNVLLTMPPMPVVFSVQRELRFLEGEEPAYVVVLNAMKKKYGEPALSAPRSGDSGNHYEWFFDDSSKSARRPGNESCRDGWLTKEGYEQSVRRLVQRAKISSGGNPSEMESTVESSFRGKPVCGHHVVAEISRGSNPELVRSFRVHMRNYKLDRKSFAKTYQLAIKAEADRKKQEVEKAKSAAPPRL